MEYFDIRKPARSLAEMVFNEEQQQQQPGAMICGRPGGCVGGSSGESSTNLDDDGRPCRTGTVWTASAHVITAVIGSGVLSLAWSMAQLGWAAGPPVLLAFAVITYYTSLLLADCYRTAAGKRNYTYQDAVKATLGGAKIWICGIVQYANLVGTSPLIHQVNYGANDKLVYAFFI